MSASHIGMSIVATDVGGGFSIGLGGLGFIMGISGSWLLFTGLIGAWAAAVFVVPKVKKNDALYGLLTYPDFLRTRYNSKVANGAAAISAIGYLGFTSAQVLAGAKLAAGSVLYDSGFSDPLTVALYIMGGIIIIYTVMGGIKAVIYTDTIQWIILLLGLFLFGIPFAYIEVGGLEGLREHLSPEFFTLTNVTITQLFNWLIVIFPIWFIAMTLYQRIYACKNVKEAKKAFFIAGLLEYPFMAFAGVILGMIARIFYPEADPEMGMPLMLREVLPVGITGIVLAAYFSAIMSTADSCLIASSGNLVNDVIERMLKKKPGKNALVRISQVTTLALGIIAIILAGNYTSVLDIILQAYSIMVAGLFFITIMALYSKNRDSLQALVSMITGGGVTVILIIWGAKMPLELDPTFYGILASVIAWYLTKLFRKAENV